MFFESMDYPAGRQVARTGIEVHKLIIMKKPQKISDFLKEKDEKKAMSMIEEAFDKDLSGERMQYDLFTGEPVPFPPVSNTSNSRHKKRPGQVFVEPSPTVPNLTMSMKEMLQRHTRGLPVPDSRDPSTMLFDDPLMNSAGVDIRTLDLIDLEELKKQTVEKIRDLKKQEAKERKDKELKRLADADKKHQELLKSLKFKPAEEDGEH